MIFFNDLASLIAQHHSIDNLGTLFVNSDEWSSEPEKAKFLLLVGDDELEDVDDEHRPVLANENDMEYFFNVEMFQSVIELQVEKKPESDLGDFIHAINYYLEYDDFYEPRK